MKAKDHKPGRGEAARCSALFDELLAPYDEELAAFNRDWIGPDKYECHEETLVARYEAQSDGRPVEIYCTAMPARFYTLKALDGKNSIGEPLAPFEFGTGTGTGMAKLVAQMGKAIAAGMLGWHNDPSSATGAGRKG